MNAAGFLQLEPNDPTTRFCRLGMFREHVLTMAATMDHVADQAVCESVAKGGTWTTLYQKTARAVDATRFDLFSSCVALLFNLFD